MKVNDLSVKIVISTGRIVSWPCVRALNSLQKAMMLMPCGPSAVPTGGAGLAFPAGIWSFTKPDTFFATLPPYAYAQRRRLGSYCHVGFIVAVVGDVSGEAAASIPSAADNPARRTSAERTATPTPEPCPCPP